MSLKTPVNEIVARLDERTLHMQTDIQRIADSLDTRLPELEKRVSKAENAISYFKGRWSIIVIGVGAFAGALAGVIAHKLFP